MLEQLISVSEAARVKGVSRATIYKAIHAGKLPHQSVVGHLAIHPSDLAAWMPASRGGARNLKPLSAQAKDKISKSQTKRWAERKKSD